MDTDEHAEIHDPHLENKGAQATFQQYSQSYDEGMMGMCDLQRSYGPG